MVPIAVFVNHVCLAVLSLVGVCCAQDVGGLTAADLPPPDIATHTLTEEQLGETRVGNV